MVDVMDAVERSLEQIAAIDGRLNAFVEVREGRSASRSGRGTLAGKAIGIKDCFFHEGRVPTMGSNVHPRPSTGTAQVIRRMEDAGGALVGYTNLHEWALGGTSAVTATGPIRNPWDPSRLAGGSSGGSAAALASGCIDLALGTDTAGSIRIPAAWCGVVGLKPTRATVPMHGYVMDRAPTDHIGPMARSVEDVARFLEVLADRSFPEPEVSSLRLGVARGAPFDDVEAEVAEAFESAVETLAPRVSSLADVTVEGFVDQRWANVTLFVSNAARVLSRDLEQRPEDFQPSTLDRLRWGAERSRDDIEAALEVQMRAEQVWSALFGEIDVLLSPTVPTVARPVDQVEAQLPSGPVATNVLSGALTGPMDLVGVPSLSVPCGPEGDLPVGLSITAARGHDGHVLAGARAFEDATERRWVDRIALAV